MFTLSKNRYLVLLSIVMTIVFKSLPSYANCSMTDISLQVSIHGSLSPSSQTNQVDMGNSDNCWGNTTTNVATQLYVGSGNTAQKRNSQHFVGDYNNNNFLPTDILTPTTKTQISVPIDIYSPAHDSNFFNSFSEF